MYAKINLESQSTENKDINEINKDSYLCLIKDQYEKYGTTLDELERTAHFLGLKELEIEFININLYIKPFLILANRYLTYFKCYQYNTDRVVGRIEDLKNNLNNSHNYAKTLASILEIKIEVAKIFESSPLKGIIILQYLNRAHFFLDFYSDLNQFQEEIFENDYPF